ncbi:MAG: amidohydrolase family protein [Acidimicrobiales bacterium]
MSRVLIVSSDCHAGLPDGRYRDYLDEDFREAYDRQLARLREQGDKLRAQVSQFLDEREEELAEGLTGAWDSAQRTKELDADGITAEVLFPDGTTGGNAPPFGAGLAPHAGARPERLLAGARAHNRWLAEFCADEPLRRIGLAIIPTVEDVDTAVAEAHWAKENGLGGVLIPSVWNERPPYNDPVYDPFWGTCQELELPVHTHSGAVGDFGGWDLPGAAGIFTTEAAWWASRPVWHLIWGGVFERFPEMRFCVTENGAWWVPEMVQRMDMKYEGSHATERFGDAFTRHLPLKPSEYFARNVRIGASVMARKEVALRHEIGVGVLMWGNDYPHHEGTWPHTVEAMESTFVDVPEDEARAMVGLTAAETYRLDLDALAPIVERVGPASVGVT